MIDNLFDLLKMKPELSIILGFILAIFILISFRKVIIAFIIKKYKLFTEEQVRKAIEKYYNENIKSELFEDDSSETEEIILKILRNE